MNTQLLLTIEEAAKLLGIKISRLRAAVFKREIGYCKLGRLVRFTQEDLKNFINKNRMEQNNGERQ